MGHSTVSFSIYSLQSFFYHSSVSLPVFIIDDGTLTREDTTLLQRLFTVTVIGLSDADRQLKKRVMKFPSIRSYLFQENPCLYKYVIAALLLPPFERVIFLEGDILFWSVPWEVRAWIAGKETSVLVMEHEWKRVQDHLIPDTVHALRVSLAKVFGGSYHFGLNSGFICLDSKKRVDLPALEKIFSVFNAMAYKNDWSSIESMLMLLFGTKNFLRILPPKKYLVAPFEIDYERGFTPSVTCIHYAARSKPWFMADAMKIARQTRLFRAPTQKSPRDLPG